MSLNLRELLEGRIFVGDGAMGTLLGERGVGFGHPYARANLSHPEMVAGIHEEYLRAGASVIETNTFAANRYKLETHDLEDCVRQVNVAGARLARRAANAAANPAAGGALVLGAIGPLGRPLAPIGPVSPDEDSIFEQFSEVQAQKGSPSPFFASRSRGGERLRRCFDSSLGVSSAGVGTWHEASTSPVAAASQGPSLHRSR